MRLPCGGDLADGIRAQTRSQGEHDAQHAGTGRRPRLDPVVADLRLVGDGGAHGSGDVVIEVSRHGRCWARPQSMLGRSTVACGEATSTTSTWHSSEMAACAAADAVSGTGRAWASQAAKLSSEVKTGRAREPPAR